MKILIKTRVNKDYNEVFQAFDIDLFKALKPPLIKLNVTRFDGCKKNDEVHLEVGLGPVTQRWVSRIVEDDHVKSEHYFVDSGVVLPPPLKTWRHLHRVVKDGEGSMIYDDIEFSCNHWLLDRLIYPLMYVQFWLRIPAYKKFFS